MNENKICPVWMLSGKDKEVQRLMRILESDLENQVFPVLADLGQAIEFCFRKRGESASVRFVSGGCVYVAINEVERFGFKAYKTSKGYEVF